MGQAVKVSSITDTKNAFVLTLERDVASETPEKVVGPDFVSLLDEEFNVDKLMLYPQWGFNSMTILSAGAEGERKEEKYYAIYNKETRKYLRWSKKDYKLKLVDQSDYDEIWKKKEGTFDYVQPLKVRMSFYFQLKPNGDYLRLYRYNPSGGAYKINSKWSKGNLKLILVER